MFSSWFPRPRRKKALEDFLDERNGKSESQDSSLSSSSRYAPGATGLISLFGDEGNDGTFPQQTPVAPQYSLQGSLIWDIGLRTYCWLAGYGLLRFYGGVAGSVKEEEDDDGL